MSTAATSIRSPLAMAWQRRGRAFAQFCREFSHERAGMVGLVFLLVIVVLALLAPLLAPASMLDVTQVIDNPRFAPPSWEHPLGTDHQGRELWVRMLWGARVSLLVGFAATAMSMILGTIVGLAAGHFRGWAGGALMRVIDFFLVLPSLILAIVLASVLSRGVWTIVIAIGLTSWAGTARVVRAQTLSVEARDYVERSRVLGAGHGHIIVKHLLPAVLPLVLANTTLTVGSAIIAESTLSFLGLGDTTQQSWGAVLKNSMDVSAATSGYWWYVVVPGLAIVLVVLAFTLVGRAVETIVNPTLRSR
ncbi:ABC transporter permease [Microbacterium dextranolyticum]|uniref:ABC transporter permease n=1 Tax=Microbacterium dextranolyticum TaxID=36806 RepID=A0A9W6HMI6_9MICO|nr:ABC transporter permease [Microbacterium dextranolyticum]MBM7464254.1 peptide/nickel transport system permease protein [Microbacterium dextranolyticum]GLJ95248.1 ABC transporter permease [Microbacterium dextranolyticum]